MVLSTFAGGTTNLSYDICNKLVIIPDQIKTSIGFVKRLLIILHFNRNSYKSEKLH